MVDLEELRKWRLCDSGPETVPYIGDSVGYPILLTERNDDRSRAAIQLVWEMVQQVLGKVDLPKRSLGELHKLLESGGPPDSSRWRHYKTGNLYHVLGSAIQESTQEPQVIYNPWNHPCIFSRPRAEWEQLVEWPEGSGTMVPRFRPETGTPVEDAEEKGETR